MVVTVGSAEVTVQVTTEFFSDAALALDPANTDVSSAVVAASTATVERFLRRVIGPPRSGRCAPAGTGTSWNRLTRVLGTEQPLLEVVAAFLRAT